MVAQTTFPPSKPTKISPDPYYLKERPKQWHIRDDPITWSNWYKHINWLHTPLLIGIPAVGFYGLFTTPLTTYTAIWAVIYYFITGLGITAGYHRLWAHRAYKASRPFEIFLILASSGAVEGSIRWWVRDHRAHHRYTDTDKDPYNAHKGLFYSHLGWMILKQNPNQIGRADISDLNADPLIVLQHKLYGLFAIGMGFVVPTIVAGLGWGDYWGGFYYAALLRLTFVHHATFCVNSLAHYLGDHTFDDRRTPRDHFITAILSLGEGYHNFHHEFPQDYRNAIRFYQYDPTKWLIKILSYFGLTQHLKKFPDNEIKKGKFLMEQKKLDEKKVRLHWGVEISKLPVLTFEEFQEGAQKKNWICIEGIIHDVSSFIDEHPGGRTFLTSSIGKDMTTAFNGGVYDHSNAARNLMSNFRVGVIAGGVPERPTYRAGRKPTATRVYTVNQESRYLVVENVPALGLTKELLELFALYGVVEEYRYLDDYPCEEFTDVYWVKFQSLPQARAAKRKVDDQIFFSSHLRVRYGPEYETIEDTRQKLQDRRNVIYIKTSEQKNYEKKNENKSTEFPKIHQNDVSQSSTSTIQPGPVMYPQPDPSAYYNYNNYYDYPYTSAQSQEPPIPGVEYPTSFSTSFASTYNSHTDPSSSLSSTVNIIRQRINIASEVSSVSIDKDKGDVNRTLTDSSIKSTRSITTSTKRRRI